MQGLLEREESSRGKSGGRNQGKTKEKEYPSLNVIANNYWGKKKRFWGRTTRREEKKSDLQKEPKNSKRGVDEHQTNNQRNVDRVTQIQGNTLCKRGHSKECRGGILKRKKGERMNPTFILGNPLRRCQKNQEGVVENQLAGVCQLIRKKKKPGGFPIKPIPIV